MCWPRRSLIGEGGLTLANYNPSYSYDERSMMLITRSHPKKIFTDKNNYLIASLMLGFLAAFFAFICINISLHVYRAKNWLENSYVIEDVKITGGRTKKIYIKYRYNFNNIEYIGERKQYISYRSIFTRNPKLEDLIKNYQIGSTKTSYINPQDPTEIVINNKFDSILLSEIFYYLLPSIFLFVISFIYFRKSGAFIAKIN